MKCPQHAVNRGLSRLMGINFTGTVVKISVYRHCSFFAQCFLSELCGFLSVSKCFRPL